MSRKIRSKSARSIQFGLFVFACGLARLLMPDDRVIAIIIVRISSVHQPPRGHQPIIHIFSILKRNEWNQSHRHTHNSDRIIPASNVTTN